MDYAEKARIARESYDAFNRQDLDALLALYDPECEWHMSNYSGWPEKSVYGGHVGMTEFFETWHDPWADFHLEIEQQIDMTGDRCLLIAHGRGRGRGSGAQVELPPLAQIVEFRGARILRVDNYSDVAEGRRDAGLAGPGRPVRSS
jgi:ketosteroid isomerase-like protein